MSAQIQVKLEEMSMENESLHQHKKFRKTRDYFGKRKFNGGGGENAKLGFIDEDSNDSGVSTRDVVTGGSSNSAVKGEPNSPSTASVASSSSSSDEISNQQQQQRVKVMRLEDDTSFQYRFQGPVASSTPLVTANSQRTGGAAAAPGTPVSAAKPTRAQNEKRVTGGNASKTKLDLEQIKRAKWEMDLQKVIGLIQNGMPMISKTEGTQRKGKKPKDEKHEAKEVKVSSMIRMSSSKRRIIPKQRISV